jgi:uncharacterized protein
VVASQSQPASQPNATHRQVRVVELDSLLSTNLESAEGHWGRFRGLMLRKVLPVGAGLIIPGCTSIHMMFMRYPIDAVFYDEHARVLRISRAVRPWIGFGWGGRRAAGVIELPAGAAAEVQIGNQLEFLP